MEDSKLDILKRRIQILKDNFETGNADEDGDITSLQEDHIRAFRLLCHAEVENYIEDLALKILNQSETLWKEKQISNYNLSALLVNHEEFKVKMSVNQKVLKIVADYRGVVNSNHGIKEENINKLFKPLGYEINDFDSVFISDLSSYGSTRGIIAHTSASSQVAQAFNFSDEKTKIDQILSCLNEFEETLHNLQINDDN